MKVYVLNAVCAEQPTILFGKHVHSFADRRAAVAVNLLAVVATIISVAVVKHKFPYLATVGATRARLKTRLVVLGGG